MDLRQLRHFLAVLEHGSILGAAQVIHLTQPALSRSIQTLETAVGVRLFERTARGIAPTAHGLLLAQKARTLVADADDAIAMLRGVRGARTLALDIGVGTHLAGIGLPRVVASLVHDLPHLQVNVTDGSAEELIAALRRGELDVALCAWPADGVPADLVFEELLRSDLVVVCRATHPFARQRRVSLEELAGRRWALAERPRAIGQVLRLAFAAQGLSVPQGVVRSTSLTFVGALLQQTDLLSLLPRGYVHDLLRDGHLIALRTALPVATARLGILRRRREEADSTVRAFVEALRAALPPLPAQHAHAVQTRRAVGRRQRRAGSMAGKRR